MCRQKTSNSTIILQCLCQTCQESSLSKLDSWLNLVGCHLDLDRAILSIENFQQHYYFSVVMPFKAVYLCIFTHCYLPLQPPFYYQPNNPFVIKKSPQKEFFQTNFSYTLYKLGFVKMITFLNLFSVLSVVPEIQLVWGYVCLMNTDQQCSGLIFLY